ncbi:MAG: hypothetical protein U0790_00055 [Isosphaeraceae bacterium]
MIWLLWAGEGPDAYLVAAFRSMAEAERGRDRYSARWPRTVVSVEGRPIADDTWDVRAIHRGVLSTVDFPRYAPCWENRNGTDFVPPGYSSSLVHRPAGVAGMTQYIVESAVSPEHARELAEEARRKESERRQRSDSPEG